MIWHLLGAGAMGSLAAFYLQRAGLDVEVLDVGRDELGQAGLLRELHFLPGTPSRDALQLDDAWLPLQLPWARAGVIDFLILATKAGRTREALSYWLPCLAEDVTILCLQNGMGQLDDIDLPKHARILPVVTTSAAFREGGRITVVAENTTLVGDGSEQAPPWVATLAPHWPGLAWRADIHAQQLAKLAINAVINPLTALHRCRNGELLSAPLHAELVALAAEVDDILLARDASWPGGTQAHAEQVARLTAGNTSSMLADVQANRPTEIAFINGWLVREAVRLGKPAPLNAAVIKRLG